MENGKIYRAQWEVESSVSIPNEAIDFRLRATQKGAWSTWDRLVLSNYDLAPSAGNPKSYDVILNPVVTGPEDNSLVLSFDLTSFDSNNDKNSWLYLNSVKLDEVNVAP